MKKMTSIARGLVLFMAWAGLSCCSFGQTSNVIVLTNSAGLRWELQQQAGGWTLGQVLLHGKPVDSPLNSGVIGLHPRNNSGDIWLKASTAVQVGNRTATLSGSNLVGGVMLRFEVALSLSEDLPKAELIPRWSVNQTLSGWDISLAYHGVGNDWRCTLYPVTGNSMTELVGSLGEMAPPVTNGVVDVQRLKSVGVPSVIVFRPDMSLVTLFGIDPAFDYLNLTNWTANTGFYFNNKVTAPQFRIGPSDSTVGTGNFVPGVKYVMPLQILLNDSGNSVQAISQLARDWVKANHYAVQPMFVRTPDQAFKLFLQGRRNSTAWIPGKGYVLQAGSSYLYNADSAQSAYFEYLVYTNTGDAFWRQRSIEQMNFLLQAKVTTKTSNPLFGCMHTGYGVDSGSFESNDRGSNPGYKVDVNIFLARYMLQTWALFKQNEGIDRQDWYQAAVNAVNWALAQRNPDGGLPQKLDLSTLTPSMSVASARTMAALPVIASLTGNTNYLTVLQSLEKFVTNRVEGCYWFTGQHPDLPPWTFESDSIWGLCEYWLNKYDRTGDSNCLKRAEADGWMGFMMLCPGQLRWVNNPTQACHAEQTYFAQYSNYSYQNEKLKCLYRLGQLTGEQVFSQLFDRITQSQFWCQQTAGPSMGAQCERMADPWQCTTSDINSTGSLYINELSLAAHLQLLEMGMVKSAISLDSQGAF